MVSTSSTSGGPDPAQFPIHWAWEDGPLAPGLTCVFRVKNEARNLPWVLPPMFDAVQHVVLVDNGSDDGTAEVAQRVAAEHGASTRFTLAGYPFQVARAGTEHLGTPPDSVHSLTYFYNWSFAHVRTSYSMKWDGDMVLTAEGVELLRDLSWQLEDSNAVVAIPRHPMSVESESVAWLDLGYRFLEPWVYPMGPEFTFVKAFEWEVREFPPTSERIVAPEGMCVELKWLDQDEFAHWSDTAFDPVRTPRKAREMEVNRALHEGRGHEIEGLKRIEAPAGVHVVDYVTRQWMQLEPRPLTLRLELQETPPLDEQSLMGPGPALDAFVQEAPRSYVVIGPDGEVEPGKYDRVAVTVRDRGELRALRVPKGVRTKALAVWLDEGSSALSLTPRPEWPALTMIRSRAVDGGWLTVIRFDAPVPVHRVVTELGRQAVWPDHAGQHGVVLAEEATDKVAADPLELSEPNPMVELGPLDERLLNPMGFERDVDGPVLDLSELDWGRGPTEALVRGLRANLGVHADLPQATPLLAARVIAGLAMAGIPLSADRVATRVAAHLGEAVTAAITTEVDLTDPQAREEHSVVLRRAALTAYASTAWRARLGALAGVRVAAQPAVSVVMATRRPDLLEHALRQVARQRGVERLELVLAPHGFEPDAAQVREALSVGGDVEAQVVPQPGDAIFGDVLHAAVSAASGDVVLKMDDDDWYAPDVVADLLLARSYSGAELVGMPDDLYYLEPTDETVRLGQPTEVYRQFVAGGTLMVDRGLLRAIGGFRTVRRHVDAELIAAVRAAGGATYRTHGLGYVLRRTDAGHTWQADLDGLRARAAQVTPGFWPGRLMEV